MAAIPIDTRPFVREATKLLGSQGKLARAIGRSQSRVNQLCHEVVQCSAEDAVAIETATAGAIPRWSIRPDLWEPPVGSPQNDPPSGTDPMSTKRNAPPPKPKRRAA